MMHLAAGRAHNLCPEKISISGDVIKACPLPSASHSPRVPPPWVWEVGCAISGLAEFFHRAENPSLGAFASVGQVGYVFPPAPCVDK